jgi:Immunity protein 26
LAKRKVVRKRGDIFEFPLDEGTFGYGHVLGGVMVGFYAIKTAQHLPCSEVINGAVAFRAKCALSRVADGTWPIIGNLEAPASMRAPVRLWRANGPDFIFLDESLDPWLGSDERRSTAAEIAGLEESGISDGQWVVDRLKLFLRGEPWRWLRMA